MYISYCIHSQISQKSAVRKNSPGVNRYFQAVMRNEKVTLISGAICPDHVHMYLAIPPKLSVSEVVAYLKGKSALMIFDNHPEFRGRWGERHMWARGYYVDTVGNVNEETIKNYIKEQENSDKFDNDK